MEWVERIGDVVMTWLPMGLVTAFFTMMVLLALAAVLSVWSETHPSCVEADFFDTPAVCTAGHLDVVSEDPLIVRCVCPIEEE